MKTKIFGEKPIRGKNGGARPSAGRKGYGMQTTTIRIPVFLKPDVQKLIEDYCANLVSKKANKIP